VEVYPDLRFITEVRYEDKPHLTMVAGLPASSKDGDSFAIKTVGRNFDSHNLIASAHIVKAVTLLSTLNSKNNN